MQYVNQAFTLIYTTCKKFAITKIFKCFQKSLMHTKAAIF